MSGSIKRPKELNLNMKLASIEKIIKLSPIDGADKIECATVLGYQIVVNKDKFKEGDLVIFHFPDTILPDRPEYEFARKSNFRLKVCKFRKQISQGFVLSLEEALSQFGELSTLDGKISLLLKDGVNINDEPIPEND